MTEVPTSGRHRTADVIQRGHESAPLTAFVPRLAVELAELDVPSHSSVAGSMLSADISGFTALSEKLAGKGKAGAEEITEIVNKCFTALIEAAYEYGGEVLKFGGDALLVLFRDERHQVRAAEAGLAMQRALRASAAAKRANLTMTVGVAVGPFDVFCVGSDYRELLVTGPRASDVIRLEGAAEKGDTLVSNEVAACLPAAMLVRAESGGWVIDGSSGLAEPGPRPRDFVGVDLTPFVPAAVREQLSAFAGLGGEHRLVTVGFLMVGGVDALLDSIGPDGVAAAFHHLVDDVGAECAAFGVTLLHTDIAPDGVKFVLCAGAPVNPGDTSDAMLQAALRIAAIDSPFVLRQGVQTGRVFAGFLGSAHRRTYTLMGDPVNTAARMLGKADDREVVAVEAVVKGTRTVFLSDPLEPFLVKGKSEPIMAHKVRRASDTVRRDTSGTRLFGREHELELLTRAIGELGEVVVLSGPAGVGKSRLLDAAWDRAEGLRIFQGACTPYGAASPYSLFRPLLRVGSGIPVDVDPTTAGKRLTGLVWESAHHLTPLLPLLAVPFGADVASTPEADAIDPQFRRARIHDVVVEFLDAVLDGPVFLVIEDLHWVDDASGELVNHLVRASESRPWAGVLTRRPHGAWEPPDASNLRSLDVVPLSEDDIRTLAIDVSDLALSDAQLDVIVERAGGNPLFAIELVRAVGRGGEAELPDSIEDLIATRIDDLPPAQRRLIRVASVFGQEFDLTAVDAVSTEYAHLGSELDDMVEHRRGSRYRFRHAMYRDAAYGGIPFARRRELHGRAAAFIEANASSEQAAAPLLSLHYSEAKLHEQAWRYSVRTGELAIEQHAASEAALAFERALDAARFCRAVDGSERSRAAEALGDQYYLLGRFDEAVRAFARARRNDSDPIRQVELICKLGAVYERRGELGRAVRSYTRAARLVPSGTSRREWLAVRARATLGEIAGRSRRGEGERCLALSRAALVDAERAGDQEAVALALERMHLSLVMLRRRDDEGVGVRALDAHRSAGDRAAVARAAINLGVEAYHEDDWNEASARYLEALDAASDASSIVLMATAAMNSAEILCDQGYWDRAADLFADALRNHRAVGYRVGVAATTLFSSVPLMRRGDLDDAQAAMRSARELLTELEMVEWIDDLDSREVEWELLSRGVTGPLAAALVERVPRGSAQWIRARRTLGLSEAREGRPEHAIAHLLDAISATADGYERALTLDALDRVDPAGPDADASRSERDRIFARLGVIRPAPLVPEDLGRTVRSSARLA